MDKKIAIIGGGNIGMAMAEGFIKSGKVAKDDIIITRHKADIPRDKSKLKFNIQSDNVDAVKRSRVVVLSVLPMVMAEILDQIKDELTADHILISIATGITLSQIEDRIGKKMPIIRAMPNTALKIQESMTCLACNEEADTVGEEMADLFQSVGKSLIIDETYISAATALGSCGIAFFLRVIRAAAQGGTQIGFHAEEAQLIAAQTAKGAAELVLQLGSHPEDEIDKVTTPRGITIAGLNEMEHNGLSSAFIKGIVKSYEKSQVK